MKQRIQKILMMLAIIGVISNVSFFKEARADGWIPPAKITEIATKGDGEKFVRLNTDGNGYMAGDPIYIHYDLADKKINNINHQKEFYAQIMMAFALDKKIRMEVFQKTYPDALGEVQTRWVMQSVMLHPED